MFGKCSFLTTAKFVILIQYQLFLVGLNGVFLVTVIALSYHSQLSVALGAFVKGAAVGLAALLIFSALQVLQFLTMIWAYLRVFLSTLNMQEIRPQWLKDLMEPLAEVDDDDEPPKEHPRNGALPPRPLDLNQRAMDVDGGDGERQARPALGIRNRTPRHADRKTSDD